MESVSLSSSTSTATGPPDRRETQHPVRESASTALTWDITTKTASTTASVTVCTEPPTVSSTAKSTSTTTTQRTLRSSVTCVAAQPDHQTPSPSRATTFALATCSSCRAVLARSSASPPLLRPASTVTSV